MVRRLGAMVAIGGGTAGGARTAARRLADGGAIGLLSFGLAGGLDPELRPGAVLVPRAIVVDGRHVAADPVLCRMLGGPTPHALLGAEHVVSSQAEKRLLWQQTGCAAVDVESGAVAAVAAESSLPFAALRAVCDPAWRSLPPAALSALDARGAVAARRVMASVAAQPWQLPVLLALARDAMIARRALLRHLASVTRGKSFIFPR